MQIKDGLGPDHIASEIDSGVPLGCIMMWASNTEPAGGKWIFCHGQSTDSYPDLKAVVGDNVPDLQDRVPVGLGPTTFKTLKGHAGANSRSVKIASGNLPKHTHTANHEHGYRYPNTAGGTAQYNMYYFSDPPNISGGIRMSVGKTYHYRVGISKTNITTSDGGFANSDLTYYPTQASTTLNFIIKAVA